jgi:hypothetical protein
MNVIAPRGVEINLAACSSLAWSQDGGRTAVAEDFRLIKRPLLRNARSEHDVPAIHHGNLIVVTSA